MTVGQGHFKNMSLSLSSSIVSIVTNAVIHQNSAKQFMPARFTTINFINMINHINHNDINMAAGFTEQLSGTVSCMTTSVKLQSALLGDI